MEIKREYKYDNIKCIMIFFVVFGHLLESINGKISDQIYIFIYTFHIPILVYVSGYFSKGNIKSITKYIYIYLIWQTIFYLFDVNVLKTNIIFSLAVPNWTMWYIFALIIWNLAIKFWDKFLTQDYLTVLICSICMSLLISFFNEVGYEFSASRIITFFPYFLLGYINKKKMIKNFKTNKYFNWILGCALIISITYCIKTPNSIYPFWLYGTYSYKIGRI